ncbi:MAG: hypothetical protein WAM71_08830 [Candidatus Korobacteraceae bacterium]
MGSDNYSAAPLDIDEIAEYHQDVLASLRVFFSSSSEEFTEKYVGYSVQEVRNILRTREYETDLRSTLILLAAMEGLFRVDYEDRSRRRLRDPLSRALRELHKEYGSKARLDEDILEKWKLHGPELPGRTLIGELRGALNFRNWLAHGRYYTPKLGRKYDYPDVFRLADAVVNQLLAQPEA